MAEEELTQQQLAAFNEKIYHLMVTELATLPFNQLCNMHDHLVDRYNETADPDQGEAVSIALTAMGEAIRRGQVKRLIN